MHSSGLLKWLMIPLLLLLVFVAVKLFSGGSDAPGTADDASRLTPDEANLAPERGGLIVYDVMAPDDWDPRKYSLEEIVQGRPCKAYTVPYQYNRALFFNSGLFHASDQFKFQAGYLQRRLNLTMLFGIHNKSAEEQKLLQWAPV